MSPDGPPFYDRSRSHSGAYLTTCYSGVTLAAIGAGLAWGQRRRPPGRGRNPVIAGQSIRCEILPSNIKSAVHSAQRVSDGTRPSRARRQGSKIPCSGPKIRCSAEKIPCSDS